LSYELYFFSERTIFFSYNKLVNITFSHSFSAKRSDYKSQKDNGAALRHSGTMMNMQPTLSGEERVAAAAHGKRRRWASNEVLLP
jgi:hypothetical protein